MMSWHKPLRDGNGLMPRLMPLTIHFFLTLNVNTIHFNGLPAFSIFEISRILSLPFPRCYK
jgi:hypothetical protein